MRHNCWKKTFIKRGIIFRKQKLQSVPGIVTCSKLSQICKWNNFCIIYKTLYLTLGNHALGVILYLCLNIFWVINSWIVFAKPKKLKKLGVQYFCLGRLGSLAHLVETLIFRTKDFGRKGLRSKKVKENVLNEYWYHSWESTFDHLPVRTYSYKRNFVLKKTT